ncbi:MAG: hypothetical protein PHP22_11560 [Oscillospiraceae bacterium]|nr:hypothetical protein [Oscillospiraceae bacterium]
MLENDTVYTYDDNGALISVSGPDRSATYTYNDLGRMSTATVTTGTETVTESYLYDWAGTRTAKITDGVLTYYLVDTGGVLSQVLAELDHTGALITHYTRGEEIISLSRPGEKHYYLHDGHGSVRALSDTDGQVTDTYLFDAFGNLLSKTGTTANDFLYTGEQYDINTGFYYLRARYMNPATGTFTSPDAYAGTIFDPVSLHKYLYANANPVMNRDPSGYFTLTEMESAMAIQAIIGAAMNGTTKAVLGAIGYFREGGRFNMDFVGTFMSDFIWGAIDGAIIGGLFGAFGYLATQSLLASFLLRSFFGTMGVKSAWDFIQDLRRGDYGRAILDGLSAVLFFWGASQNYYRGGGLGNHGGNQGKNNPADDVADDAADVADDVAKSTKEPIGPDFKPNGPAVQEGINPNSLIPKKDLSTLDPARMADAIKYAGNRPIIVDKSGAVLDGHHRLAYAIKNNQAVDASIGY